LRKSFSFIIPVVEISMVTSICKLLEAIFSKFEVKGLEMVFVFACVWSIGGGFAEKDNKDYRKDFSNWWKDTWKQIRFPNKGTVFDYFVDYENNKFEEWSKMEQPDVIKDIDTSKAISNYTIPTNDTVSIQYLMKLFIENEHYPLLVGNAGSGKTQIAKGLINDLVGKQDKFVSQVVNFNFYTDSILL
jgi:dynein heavy chain